LAVDIQMLERRYYSARTGKNPSAVQLDLPTARRLFYIVYTEFRNKSYFQEALGYSCVDAGAVDGRLGQAIESAMFKRLRKSDLWPIDEMYTNYSEADLFDVIEFLYDCVSKPVDGYYHSYGECGWHYHVFDYETGRVDFRLEMNAILQDYQDGYELSEAGEILEASQTWGVPLIKAPLPVYDAVNVETRVDAAILKFRRSTEDKRDAIRDLADVLEFLRPKLKTVLTSKDESDLFNIANNFAIRHHHERQKRDYDQAIWYSWMFYVYLATIHASLRLIKRQETATSPIGDSAPPRA
jgi:hypothetical protein